MSELDALILPAVLFFFFMLVAFMWVITTDVFAGLTTAGYPPDPAATTAKANMFSVFDWAILIIAAGWVLAGMYLASQARAQPIFFILYLAIAIAMFFVAPMMTNIAHDMLSVNNMDNFETQFPTIIFVIENLPKITLGAIFLIAVVQYSGILGGFGGQTQPGY